MYSLPKLKNYFIFGLFLSIGINGLERISLKIIHKFNNQ